MHRVTSACCALLIVSGALIQAGCGGGDSTHVYPIDAAPNYYHVSLILDGQVVTLNFGRLNINPDAPTLTLSPAGDFMRIDSETARGYYDDQDVAISLMGSLVVLPGYLGVYDWSLGKVGMDLQVMQMGVPYHYVTSAGSVTLDSFGAVGAEVHGTLSMTFTAVSAPSPMFGPSCIATGEFRLLRMADSYYSTE